MRSFDVTVKGQVQVVRAADFIRPSEVPERQWLFLAEDGAVLWAYAQRDVSSIVERVEYVETAVCAAGGR